MSHRCPARICFRLPYLPLNTLHKNTFSLTKKVVSQVTLKHRNLPVYPNKNTLRIEELQKQTKEIKMF
jgi:hypothetical protein